MLSLLAIGLIVALVAAYSALSIYDIRRYLKRVEGDKYSKLKEIPLK